MGDQTAIVKQPTAGAVPLPSTTNLVPVVGATAVPSGRSALGLSWNAQVCPPGMEHLLPTSFLAVQQIKESFQVFNFETNNRYEIMDMYGRRIYLAVEESACCKGRDFPIHVLNYQGAPCLKLDRPLNCCNCRIERELLVSLPNGFVLGRVAQENTGCTLNFFIYDEGNNRILEIESPCNMCTCGDDVFLIYDMARSQVGEIRKRWGGIIKEMFTTEDNFGVSFPLEMDPRWKTLILGALFLIDYMYFENRHGHHHHHH